MKFTFKFFSIVLSLISTSLFAGSVSDSTSISVRNLSTGVYQVKYQTRVSGNVKLSIYDKGHQLVFTEKFLGTTSFNRPYNFVNLDEGEYTIELSDRNGMEVEKVSYYLPVVVNQFGITRVINETNKYEVMIKNPDSDLVNLTIYDKHSNVLHREVITVRGKYSRIYNLMEIKSGTFELTSSSGSIQKLSF